MRYIHWDHDNSDVLGVYTVSNHMFISVILGLWVWYGVSFGTAYPFIYWLMVWNIDFIFPYIGNVIIPTDFHIFPERFKPPTSLYSSIPHIPFNKDVGDVGCVFHPHCRLVNTWLIACPESCHPHALVFGKQHEQSSKPLLVEDCRGL